MERELLYVIGNGFDLHHWHNEGVFPNTSYLCFAQFLKENDADVFEWITRVLGLPVEFDDEDDNELWSELEENLANLDEEEVWNHVNEYLDDIDRFNAGSIEAEKIVNYLTKEMKSALQKFIRGEGGGALEYPVGIHQSKLKIRKDALFLNFNYTNTLQKYYGINANHICYIHGNAFGEEELQLGHGVSPEVALADRRQEEVMPSGLSSEQAERWCEQKSDEFSLSAYFAEGPIHGYWSDSWKDVERNIRNNKPFFSILSSVRSVVVMGHSLSTIDLPYFSEIRSRILQNAYWHVSYFHDWEKEGMRTALLKIGVPPNKICFFMLSDVLLSR